MPISSGEYRCALVIDKEGFSARWFVPPGEVLERGTAAEVDIEYLSPTLAQPRFAQGAVFRVLIGDSFVADGRVL